MFSRQYVCNDYKKKLATYIDVSSGIITRQTAVENDLLTVSIRRFMQNRNSSHRMIKINCIIKRLVLVVLLGIVMLLELHLVWFI